MFQLSEKSRHPLGIGLGRKGTSELSFSSIVILRLVSATDPLLSITLPLSLPESVPDTGQHVGHPISPRVVQAGGSPFNHSPGTCARIAGAHACSLANPVLVGVLPGSPQLVVMLAAGCLPCCPTLLWYRLPSASIPDGMDRDAFCIFCWGFEPSYWVQALSCKRVTASRSPASLDGVGPGGPC